MTTAVETDLPEPPAGFDYQRDGTGRVLGGRQGRPLLRRLPVVEEPDPQRVSESEEGWWRHKLQVEQQERDELDELAEKALDAVGYLPLPEGNEAIPEYLARIPLLRALREVHPGGFTGKLVDLFPTLVDYIPPKDDPSRVHWPKSLESTAQQLLNVSAAMVSDGWHLVIPRRGLGMMNVDAHGVWQIRPGVPPKPLQEQVDALREQIAEIRSLLSKKYTTT